LSAEYKPDDVKEPLQLCEITPGRRLHAINSVIIYYYYYYYYYVIVIYSLIKSARTLRQAHTRHQPPQKVLKSLNMLTLEKESINTMGTDHWSSARTLQACAYERSTCATATSSTQSQKRWHILSQRPRRSSPLAFATTTSMAWAPRASRMLWP